MTDYIKREDAMELLDMLLEHYHDTGVEVIKHTATIAPKEFHISEEDDIADFNFEIDGWKKDFSNIPSADVAPVVRCEECKHLVVLNARDLYAHCKRHDISFEPFEYDTRTNYCSWAERKDDE